MESVSYSHPMLSRHIEIRRTVFVPAYDESRDTRDQEVTVILPMRAEVFDDPDRLAGHLPRIHEMVCVDTVRAARREGLSGRFRVRAFVGVPRPLGEFPGDE
jgi:hypothetical protein